MLPSNRFTLDFPTVHVKEGTAGHRGGSGMLHYLEAGGSMGNIVVFHWVSFALFRTPHGLSQAHIFLSREGVGRTMQVLHPHRFRPSECQIETVY